MPVPPYRIRISSSARRARLRVSPRHGVEVILPRGFDPACVPALVAGKEGWIRDALQRVEREPVAGPPARIALGAVGRDWAVVYEERPGATGVYERTGQRLVVRGAVGDPVACYRALRRWLARQAHAVLVPWLEHVSVTEGLPFGRVRVGNQATRWGSCSHAHTISLNLKLLFLPPDVVRYVLIHELCHTLHFNHGPSFWAAVAAREPLFREHEQALRQAGPQIPPWVHA